MLYTIKVNDKYIKLKEWCSPLERGVELTENNNNASKFSLKTALESLVEIQGLKNVNKIVIEKI